MTWHIETMTQNVAMEILSWRYEPPYDFYNNEVSEEALTEIMDGSYSAILDEQQSVIGFFCIGINATVPAGQLFGAYDEALVDMGLGMNPSLVGQGNGFAFCSYITTFIKGNYKDIPIRLTVATFNQRAVHLYKKLGFVQQHVFKTERAQFITMVKRLV